jgi:molecular chaperone DnaK
MVKEAEQFSEQDKKKREEAELRNNADGLIYTAERTKKDLADKLTQEQTGKIDTAVSALKDALASNDMAQVKAKTEELQKVLQEVGTVIYQQAAAEQAKQKAQKKQADQEPSAPSGSDDKKVVDSEDYEVK